MLDVLVDEEGLRDRRRISEPGGLDDDRIELALALHQAAENAHQVRPTNYFVPGAHSIEGVRGREQPVGLLLIARG